MVKIYNGMDNIDKTVYHWYQLSFLMNNSIIILAQLVTIKSNDSIHTYHCHCNHNKTTVNINIYRDCTYTPVTRCHAEVILEDILHTRQHLLPQSIALRLLQQIGDAFRSVSLRESDHEVDQRAVGQRVAGIAV
jgi:hypothetical protein